MSLAVQTKLPIILLSCDADGANWSLNGIAFTPIDGPYPDYRRAIPQTHSGEAAQFDPSFIAVFAKIAKTLGVKALPIIRHNGEHVAQVQIPGMDAEFVGAVAPRRCWTSRDPDPGMVQWCEERRL